MRARLTLAFLAVASATLFVSGGSAGNRTAEVTFQALPGDSVTYGERYATTTTFKNTGKSTFTHVELHQLVPVTTGPNPVSATLVESSCGAVVVGNEAVCDFGSLGSGGTVVATLVWQAPPSGAGCTSCLTTDGKWLINERKATNANEAFGFPNGAFAATLLGGDGSSETKRAGGYETEASTNCVSGAGNLHTNPAIGANNPVTSTVCFPVFTIPPGSFAFGYASSIDEITTQPPVGSHKELGQSVVCIAALGQSCVVGHTPANWGTSNKARHIFKILESALNSPKTITKVFHNGFELPKCSGPGSNPNFAQGCVVSITPPSSSFTRSTSSGKTHPPSGPRIWTVTADAPTNGPWSW
jgi:hypothetical protein